MIITNRFAQRMSDILNNGGGAINITTFAVGNGGTPEGTEITPSASMTALAGEVFRADIGQVYDDLQQPGVKLFDCEVPGSEGPFWMTEIGLFDDGAANAGTPELMAIGGYPKTQKMDPDQSGVSNDYQITCALQLSPAESAVVSVVLNPYIHEFENHKHNGSDTAQVDYKHLTGTEGLEDTIRSLQLMHQCKRSDIKRGSFPLSSPLSGSLSGDWVELAKIKLVKAKIPAASAGDSSVHGLFFVSVLAASYDSNDVELILKVGDVEVKTWGNNSQPYTDMTVTLQYPMAFPYDTDATLKGKGGMFVSASLIFIPGGWETGL